MRKHQQANGGVNGVGDSTSTPLTTFSLSSCLDMKPVVATMVVITLVMALWQLQPYESLVLSRSTSSSCATPNTTTTTINTNSGKLSTVTPTTPSLPNAKTEKLPTVAKPSLSNATTIEKLSTVVTTTLPNTTAVVNLAVAATDSLQAKVVPRKNPEPTKDPNKREFKPYGSAAALFVQMGAYRGGPTTFAIIGLASKPTHVYGKPWFKCEWVPNNPNRRSVRALAYKMLPDWGYGRVYTVVVVNCTFKSNPNLDNSGGKLFLNAYYSPNPRKFERFVSLEEPAGAYDESKFSPPFQYDYLYCGSSLYGNLSALRIREWMAYHAHFFGPRSHFVFHDAGGVSPEVAAVLRPWVKAGRATVQDVRDQDQYDGWYYNQFLVVNDCLHRYRHAANWTFFFDVDEYIYLPGRNTLESVLRQLQPYTQFTIEQNPMSSKLCVRKPNHDYSKEWGFEKLVFRNSITGIRRDRKYAIQARNAYATGVHMSENVIGPTTHKTESLIRYYHYHNSINVLGEPCRELVPMPAKNNVTWFEKIPYVYDSNMKRLAGSIKRFEEQTIGQYRE